MKQTMTLRHLPAVSPRGKISRKQLALQLMSSSTLKAACLLVALIVSAPFARAQYHPAVLPDNPYSTPLWPNSGTNPNSSSMDYTLESSTPWGGPYVLKATAVDYAGGGYSGMVYVDDNEGLGWYGFNVDPNPGFTINPDVAICNNFIYHPGSFPNSYFIPIVYNEAGTVYLQIGFFFIPGNGSGGGSGYFTYLNPIRVSNIGVATSPARIDAEAKFSAPNAFGSPTTDNVTITWAEAGTGNIMACAVSINAIIAMMPTLPTTLMGLPIAQYKSLIIADNIASPDVAMVERVGATGGSFDDVAIFTYLINSIPQSLMYVEWNVTTGAVSPTITLNGNGNLAPPRIDAIDDFNYNNPFGPFAYYTVVTTGASPFHPIFTAMAFNNLTPPGGADLLAPVGLLGPEIPSNATVACAPTSCAGNIASGNYGYAVQYFGQGPFTTYLAERIDWTTGGVLGTDFYQVPMNPVTGNTNSIASSNNEDGSIAAPQYLFSAWDDGTTNVWSKLDMICPFSFRQDKAATQNTENYAVKKVANGVVRIMPVDAAQGAWGVSPNPASNNVMLSAGNMDKDKLYTYGLTDVAGRVIASAPVANAQQNIDISTLAPGIYLLAVYENGQQIQAMKVVKQ